MKIITRAEWGARAPRRRALMSTPSPRLWLHHTAGPTSQTVRQIQAYHMDVRRYNDIAYSFLVDQEGRIYEGRGAGVIGAHTAGDNSESHAICGIGNFQEIRPSNTMLSSIAWLVDHGRAKGWWHDLTDGHRNAPYASTDCPGQYLYARIPDIRSQDTSMEDDMPLNETDLDKITHRLVVVLRQAVGPDDAKTPAGRYFGRVEGRLKDIQTKVAELEAAGATGGLSDADVQRIVQAIIAEIAS